MPWFRPPHRLLSRLLGISTTVWLCRKVGCLARSFGLGRLGRIGVLVLRIVHRGQASRRLPDYGHLLLDALYPGQRPSQAAIKKARELADKSRNTDVNDEALQLLGEAVLLSPPDAKLYLARTEVHALKKQLVEALDNAELCVSLDSGCAAGWLAKGQAEHALGRAADAALSYEAGLRVEPGHPDLLSRLEAVRAEPPPNLLRQLRDLVFAARLGLENLFRTVEDPERTTDAFIESNSELLDAQLGLLAQTLRVNTSVLYDSPMLCDAYEQIVYACSQLVSGAPAAFSTRLRNAPDVIEGLSLALRIGWHVHHSAPKLAANALATLATCPNADDALRRQATRHLLGGMLRWLLDARPEPDQEGEEVCGCSCSVPWKAAACFLERLFEPGRPQPWVKEECEAWPDAAQLCQWLTLSIRDYHATPLGLVGLLQLPGVATAVMRSDAVVNFFIPAPLLEEEDMLDSRIERLGSGEAPPSSSSTLTGDPAIPGPFYHSSSLKGSPGEEHLLPPPQRLGEWLMASIGYLLLFIEGDLLFTVCACRALQAMAAADEDGTGRLLRSLWLGVPLLNKLSLLACSHTAALDLLHCFFQGPYQGVRVAARSLAHALARLSPNDTVNHASAAAAAAAAASAAAVKTERPANESTSAAEIVAAAAAAAAATALAAAEQNPHDEMPLEEDVVPSWAEFFQELLNELACPPDDKHEPPDLVTLYNFQEKAQLLAEHASVRIIPVGDNDTDNKEKAGLSLSFECLAVPAAWNQFTDAGRQRISEEQLVLFPSQESEPDIGSDEYVQDVRKQRRLVLMSRQSIRQSSKVQNWAQAVSAAEKAGAAVVVVFNDLDAMEPFRMGLFGEQAPSIRAFMVSGVDGAALSAAAALGCNAVISRFSHEKTIDEMLPPQWPLTRHRLPSDVAQAWSLLEAMSAHDPNVQTELTMLLGRMHVPEKRVWLTRRLVRQHRSQQAPDGGVEEPHLAFVEGDRSLTPAGQLAAIRQQMCEETGLGAEDLCGEFEVRFKNEQGVGIAVLREWMDLVAREAFLHPKHRLLKSYDHRQTFWPDPAAPFCNAQWQMDYEALGRLLGLALWQSCTLDLPLHPHACALLFGFTECAKKSTLADVDKELYQMKVEWLLSHPVLDIGFEIPFSDSLASDDAREAPTLSGSEPLQGEETGNQNPVEETGTQQAVDDTGALSQAHLPASLPDIVHPDDHLLGDERSWPGKPLLQVGAAEVAIGGVSCLIVTDDNKSKYVQGLTDWRLFRGIERQISAMARGLCQVVPEVMLQEVRGLLSPMEIAQLLSGLGEIDVDDWEEHTAYAHGLSRNSELVKWFWNAVREWSSLPEERTRLPQLLQFVTGSARVPVGGFSELVGFNGAKHPFTLAKGSHLTAQSLPMAHACICTLDLPPYLDEVTCRRKLDQMLSLGRSHFDEAAGHANQD